MSAVIEARKPVPAVVEAETTGATVADRMLIDNSCRYPVLFFFTSALLWLLAGSLLGFLASWKMNNPDFLGDWSFLTWGRIRTAHLNTVIYGWATQAGIGTAIWLMARLCQTEVRNSIILMIAGIFWNIGVTVGVVGLLKGDSLSVEWLEMPAYATPMLFIAYALTAIWTVIMFRYRKPGHVYVSQWYLLAAFFWFPWLYGTAQIILQATEVKGVVIGAVNWWFAHNVLGLWFTPIGLASAYYFIPKVIGRPVHSYYLSALGFWSIALFYSWNGMHHLIGGPYPAWLITASIVASMMMVIPVTTVAINHHMTMKGYFSMLEVSPTLRFTVFGAMVYTLVSLQGISMAFRTWNKLTHFTHYTIGHAHLGMYAFFTMTMFGAMYYIVPRLVGCEWRSPILIKWHFWLSVYGILTMVLVLSVAGVFQGAALLDPEQPFKNSLDLTRGYLMFRSFSGIALTVGHTIFAAHFALMLFRLGVRSEKPTYFTDKPSKAAREALA